MEDEDGDGITFGNKNFYMNECIHCLRYVVVKASVVFVQVRIYLDFHQA